MSEVIMENGNGNEATNKDIVVVGNIHALSQTQMWVVYDTGATQQVIKANRADIGASGYLKVSHYLMEKEMNWHSHSNHVNALSVKTTTTMCKMV